TSEGRVLYTSVYTFYTNYTDLSILTNDITSLFDLYEGEKVINIFYSSEHSAVITSMGRVFTWGKNSHGQLGNGTETEEVYPIEITSQFNLLEGESVDNISFASDTNTGAITSMGRVFMWGGNSHGELGDGTILNKSIPVLLPFVSAISTTIESIYYGEPITEYIPIKEGYTFDGWYDDIENNESYVFSRFNYISRMVSTHIYIYATRNDIVYMFGTIPYVFKECYDGESDPTLYLFKTMPAKDIMVVGTWNADE
ncbi:MAG: InlB B-repeat-containing protein, partial [Bacilli bacterium]